MADTNIADDEEGIRVGVERRLKTLMQDGGTKQKLPGDDVCATY